MRYSVLLASCAFTAAASVLSVSAAVEQSQFQALKDLVPPVATSNDIGSVRLDHSVFARADADFANVRLFGRNGGGTDIPAPRYDVNTVLSSLPPDRSEEWSAGPETANQAYGGPARATVPWSGRNLLTAAVIAMAAVLLLLIAGMIRKVENRPPTT